MLKIQKTLQFSLCLIMIGLIAGCSRPNLATLAEVENYFVPPGLLQFEAESKTYKALGGFHRWHFTELNFPKNMENGLDGLTATIEIDMASVYERTIRLTNDLRSKKYLDSKGHPRAYLKVFDVESIGDNQYVCKMTLEMKEYKKTFSSEFKVTDSGPIHVKGTADVLRTDFNIQEGDLGIPNRIHVIYDTDLALTLSNPKDMSQR